MIIESSFARHGAFSMVLSTLFKNDLQILFFSYVFCFPFVAMVVVPLSTKVTSWGSFRN